MADQLFDDRIALAVRFDGRTLRRGDTAIATLHDDGLWRTPEGVITHGLDLPQRAFTAAVTPAAVAERNREVDAAWLQEAEETLESLARQLTEFTIDDLWQRLGHPPRESRQVGAVMANGERRRWIAQTDRHRPSRRGLNHRRKVLVWRSLICQSAPPPTE